MRKNVADKIIENGVKNLKDFGYTTVDTENIFTDRIYSAFFLSMLNDSMCEKYREEIEFLIEKIEIKSKE